MPGAGTWHFTFDPSLLHGYVDGKGLRRGNVLLEGSMVNQDQFSLAGLDRLEFQNNLSGSSHLAAAGGLFYRADLL
jgi:hypothetical protein